MKATHVLSCLLVLCLGAVPVRASPSLTITKPPVQPSTLLTGPPLDAPALKGQWFKNNLGVETVRSNEFYDESSGLGAGSAAIYGYVKSIQFAPPGTPPAPILAFTVQATIYNNNSPEPVSSSGSNSHGEALVTQNEPPYAGPMVDTKLAVEFAVADVNRLPAVFVSPYRDRQPYIEATNEDQSAWYCWNPADPEQGHQPKGDYFVPTWDFGTIAVGQSATRLLGFSVPAGLLVSDTRYAVLVASLNQTNDILLNRTTSLKISTWIDEVAADTGSAQEEPPLRRSNASVFHNPGEEAAVLDFGDAPDPTYPTLLASDGARHVIVPGVQLGLQIDPEPDGQPTVPADGDDLAALDDEDGILFLNAFIPGQVSTIQVTASTSGYISGWIDFAGDGSWAQLGDQVMNMSAVPGAGTYGYAITVPPQAAPGPTYARFRFTTQQTTMSYTGLVTDGEVEDYQVVIEEEAALDYGDAMDSVSTPMYPTLQIHNGARHAIVPGVFMGARVDAEPDGQPTVNADGDDLNPALDDEDGVTLPPVLVASALAQVQVVASVAGYLNAWIDWNANSSWADPGEQVFTNQVLNPGLNSLALNVPVPPALVAGGPHSRWRFTTNLVAVPSYVGSLNNGEVEDYEVRLEVLDFGDAPDPAFPTLLANNGARHRIPSIYWLGQPPDLEADGQPAAAADGDDLAGSDDEDGVQASATLIRGSNVTLRVVASTNGYLNAWVDWNGNGSWMDPGEQIANGLPLAPATNLVPVTVPPAATLGPVMGRFRFSGVAALNDSGLAPNGEVEDYRFVLYQDGPGLTLAITNLVHTTGPEALTVQWNGLSNVTYETQYALRELPATDLVWTAWGAWINGSPYHQTDTNVAVTMKTYRVVAPYAPPPP